MDVVYNHTNAAGQNDKSVLDRIVPGYYHRLDADGNVETSSCCQNTATEHAMMEKLMVDSLVTWAKQYKVDGFRFDLMGHHMKRNMLKLRATLDALTLAKDGVDGRTIYLYGEGWNFGEVAEQRPRRQRHPANMAGTGIGTFNDRLRDAVARRRPVQRRSRSRASSPASLRPQRTDQGIGAQRSEPAAAGAWTWIRVGLAGNLKDYQPRGRQRHDRDRRAASTTTASPPATRPTRRRVINYVEAHDNETLFDAIQVKAPATDDMADRVRMQNLGMSLVLLGQGIPFFHAGVELLRSKSLDRNSYNSGDWFNRLDWTLQTHVWGSGLPPQDKNGNNWSTLRPLLGNASIIPAKADMEFAMGVFTDFLKIRKAEPVLRLATAQAIKDQVHFYDTGATQSLGLIVEKISAGTDDTESEGDLVLLFNGTPDVKSWQDTGFKGLNYQLHPIQAGGTDPVAKEATFGPLTGTFKVPARSAVVFRNMGGNVDTLPPPQATSCACSTSGTNAALGMALLALATLWRRRRGSRRQPVLSRY